MSGWTKEQMSDDKRSGPWTEQDYELIEHAVMETDRGRWFLREHAQRNRVAETQVILNALNKLERKIGRPAADNGGLESLRRALSEMADAIRTAKTDIGAEDTGEGDGATIGGATVELDAIVRSTEKATSDILQSAERIQEIAWTMREQGASEEVCLKLDEYATEIYSTCSFQDLTGQRIQRVVQTLRFVEGRLHALIDLWGRADVTEDASITMAALSKSATVAATPSVTDLVPASDALLADEASEATEAATRDEEAVETLAVAEISSAEPEGTPEEALPATPVEVEAHEDAAFETSTVESELAASLAEQLETVELDLPDTLTPTDYSDEPVEDLTSLFEPPKMTYVEALEWLARQETEEPVEDVAEADEPVSAHEQSAAEAVVEDVPVEELLLDDDDISLEIEEDDGASKPDAIEVEIETEELSASPGDNGDEPSDASEDDDDARFALAEDALNASMISHLSELKKQGEAEDAGNSEEAKAPLEEEPEPRTITLEEMDSWSTARKIAFFS
ncbi:MAG: hypothetical protein AAF619_06490 [Pseudomonadota bacterium]